jgi:hypothetical protein
MQTVTASPALPFISRTPAGRVRSYWNVPPMPYYSGFRVGLAHAAAMLARLRADPDLCGLDLLGRVITDKTLGETRHWGARDGFLAGIVQALTKDHRPALVNAPSVVLPFVTRTKAGRVRRPWVVTPPTNYADACRLGSELADAFVRYLREDPLAATENLLPRAVRTGEFRANGMRGVRVGFTAALARHLIA